MEVKFATPAADIEPQNSGKLFRGRSPVSMGFAGGRWATLYAMKMQKLENEI